MSSTYFWIDANGTSPGHATAMPSAIVVICSTACGLPRRSDSGYAAASSACTPTTRTSGRRPLIAVAMPAISPPPPVGTSTVAASGACCRISRPAVPCPATMSVWSNGWISTAPVSSANAWAATRAWVRYSPKKRTSAPYPRVALTFGIGAPSGMKTVDLDAQHLCGQRHALRVVARRRGDHPPRALRLAQPRQPDVGAPDLERPGALQVLALEQDRTAHDRLEPPRLLHRREDRGVGDELRDGLDVSERDGHGDHSRRGERTHSRGGCPTQPPEADSLGDTGRRRLPLPPPDPGGDVGADGRHVPRGPRPEHRRHRAPPDHQRPRRASASSPGWSRPTCWPRPPRRRCGARSPTSTAASCCSRSRSWCSWSGRCRRASPRTSTS